MAKFHVNPATGDAGPCRARKQCPFGDLTQDHFATKEEATKYYEKLANPVHVLPVEKSHLSALRRNAMFVEQQDDQQLMDKLELQEDTRYKKQQPSFSALELERVKAMADETLQMIDTGDRLDSYYRGVVTRLKNLSAIADSKATEIRKESRRKLS